LSNDFFNVAIGNTDDHLKNFCMLQTEAGLCLSPVYDFLPDISQNREHRLSFPQGAGTLPPDRKILERIGKTYNLSRPDKVIDDVCQAVTGWQGVFQKYNVPDTDIQKLEAGITKRLCHLV